MKRNAPHNDISRILDPSYSSAASNVPPAIYVDKHGHFHDPDYRHFPAIATQQDQLHQDDDDSAPVDNDFYSHLSNAYNRAGNAYIHPRKRNNQYSYIYASYRSPYHYFSTPPTASSSSPPTSFDSDRTVFDEADDSTFVDDSHSHVTNFKKKLGKRRSSGSSSSSSPTSSPSNKRRSAVEDRRSSTSDSAEPSPQESREESRYRYLDPPDELDEQYLLSSHTPPPNHDFDRSHQQNQQESEKHDNQEWTPTWADMNYSSCGLVSEQITSNDQGSPYTRGRKPSPTSCSSVIRFPHLATPLTLRTRSMHDADCANMGITPSIHHYHLHVLRSQRQTKMCHMNPTPTSSPPIRLHMRLSLSGC